MSSAILGCIYTWDISPKSPADLLDKTCDICCHQTVLRSYIHENCRHHLCTVCALDLEFRKINECPNCRGELDKVTMKEEPLPSHEILSTLYLLCPNCNIDLLFKDAENHIKEIHSHCRVISYEKQNKKDRFRIFKMMDIEEEEERNEEEVQILMQRYNVQPHVIPRIRNVESIVHHMDIDRASLEIPNLIIKKQHPTNIIGIGNSIVGSTWLIGRLQAPRNIDFNANFLYKLENCKVYQTFTTPFSQTFQINVELNYQQMEFLEKLYFQLLDQIRANIESMKIPSLTRESLSERDFRKFYGLKDNQGKYWFSPSFKIKKIFGRRGGVVDVERTSCETEITKQRENGQPGLDFLVLKGTSQTISRLTRLVPVNTNVDLYINSGFIFNKENIIAKPGTTKITPPFTLNNKLMRLHIC
jgi:hypothetical protein